MILLILFAGLLVLVVYFGVLPWLKCRSIFKSIRTPSRQVFFPLGGYIASSVVKHGKERDLLAWLPRQKLADEQFMVSNLLASPFIILETPQLAQEYLLNHSRYFKQSVALFSQMYFSKSIAISQGEEWGRQKKLMSNAMHFDFLKNITPAIQAQARKVFGKNESGPMSVYQPTFEIAAAVVSQAFFSKNMNEIKIRGTGLIEKLRQTMRYCVDRTPTLQFLVRLILLGKDSTKWGMFLTSKEKEVLEDFRTISGIIEEELNGRVDRLRQGWSAQQDFLDYYAAVFMSSENAQSKQVTVQEIVQQFITLFTAGADTTSTLAGMCIYFLAKEPQQRSQLEKIAKSLPQVLTFDDVNAQDKLTYFIKEVSRMYPPTFDLFPRYNKEEVTIGGQIFPKNTYFGLGIKTIMSDPKNFPNPEEFMPSRWADPSTIRPFSYLTFSSGPRSCIGERLAMLQIKIMLIELLRGFSIEVNSSAEFKMKIEQVYKLADQHMVIAKPRQTV